MVCPIRWSPRAAQHLDKICEYIAQDSREYAAIFAHKILGVVRSLPVFPASGRIVPEYNDPSIREKFHGNYRIVYRLKNGIIEVAAICHGSRLLANAMSEGVAHKH